MYLNKVKLTLHHKQIRQNFKIFLLNNHSEKKWLSYSQADELLLPYNALSVLIAKESMYVLFPIDRAPRLPVLREEIIKHNIDLSIKEIDATSMADYNLAQLLFNSLQNPSDDDWRYHNLTGHFYSVHYDPEYDKQLLAVEFKLHETLNLSLNVRTFSKVACFRKDEIKNNPIFIFDKFTYQLRRKLSTDSYKDENAYVLKSFSNKRNIIKFLAFGSAHNFNASKIGHLWKFLSMVEECLSPYMDVQLVALPANVQTYKSERTYNMASDKYRKVVEEFYTKKLKDRQINIIDSIHDTVSENLTDLLTENLKEFFDAEPIYHDEPLKDCYNVWIIHEEDYYNEEKHEDIYKKLYPDYLIQHITTENFRMTKQKEEKKKKSDIMLIKVLHELSIKEDILNGRLSRESLWPEKKWSFVCASGENGLETFYRVQIDSDGYMNFDSFNEQKQPEFYPEWAPIISIYQENSETTKPLLLYCDIHNIHVIQNTYLFPIPNYRKLNYLLTHNPMLKTAEVILVLEEFLKEQPKYKEKGEVLLERLHMISTVEISRKELQKTCLVKDVSKVVPVLGNAFLNAFVAYFSTHYDSPNSRKVYLHSLIKSQIHEPDLLRAVLDIQYYYDEEEIFHYYVGIKKGMLNDSSSRACKIRKITANGGVEVDSIMHMLDVDFIRSMDYTVIPYPFKYLREYIAMSSIF